MNVVYISKEAKIVQQTSMSRELRLKPHQKVEFNGLKPTI